MGAMLANETGPPAQAHAPFVQDLPAPHTLPQAPQLSGEPLVSTQVPQVPPHSVLPTGQTHVPAEQVVPFGQALPHAPQFKALILVSTQAVPHLVSVPQEAVLEQPLGVQSWPTVHLTPQPWQLLGSVESSTQLPAQLVRPAPHAHTDCAQVALALHCV
jgi:hypothetical protein